MTFPPHEFRLIHSDPPVYSISAELLAKSLDHLASQSLPAPQQVFPWLHGLHAENQLQLTFFTARKKALRRTPKCLRGMTIVKAGGDLSHSRLKGALAPEEILVPATRNGRAEEPAQFVEGDPKEGFSVRNFQIQACKMATVSDVVVYRDGQTSRLEVERLARRISMAQAAWQKQDESFAFGDRLFNTFILSGECLEEFYDSETDPPGR